MTDINVLVTELAAVREALEPFAKEADRYEPDEDDGDEPIWDSTHRLRVKHLRKARDTVHALSHLATELAKTEEERPATKLPQDHPFYAPRVAQTCANWTDGVCEICGDQTQMHEVSADFRCPYWRPRP